MWLAGVMVLPMGLAVAWFSPRRAPAVHATSSAAATVEARPAASAHVAGRVLDDGGNPVADARVRLVPSASERPEAGGRVLRATASNGDGAFRFDELAAGTLRVVVEHDEAGLVASEPLALDPGANRDDVVLVLERAPAVAGVVRGEGGAPIAGATVTLRGVPAWFSRTATTDGAGAFRLSLVARAATAVEASAEAYAPGSAPLVASTGERHVEILLHPAPPVAGTVVDPAGRPVARARITARCASDGAVERAPADAPRSVVASDDVGHFELPPRTIGCVAFAEHPEFAPSSPVAIGAGRPTVLALRDGGGIEGVVEDEGGAPLTGYTLGIESFRPYGGDGGFAGRLGETHDVAGPGFALEKLPPGAYVLLASFDGRPPARSSPIDVTADRVTTGVRIVAPRGAALEGTVFDETTRAPLAGAAIVLDAHTAARVRGVARTVTDARGGFRLDSVPAGPFSIRVEQQGYRVRLLAGIETAGRDVVRRDVPLHPLDPGRPSQTELGGIGAALARGDDGYVFRFLVPGAPAATAGVLQGDVVRAIDGRPADDLALSDVIERLRGEEGHEVVVTVDRPDEGMRTIAIRRGLVVH